MISALPATPDLPRSGARKGGLAGDAAPRGRSAGPPLQGEALAADALGSAADIMMAHPLALQLRNLQSLVEIGVDRNTTVVFPAPLMSTIGELGAFLARETAAATPSGVVPPQVAPADATSNGTRGSSPTT